MISKYQATDSDGLSMIVGYQFIGSNGYPIGNIQPTLEDTERIARFHEAGRFYMVKMTEFQYSMHHLYSKG